MDRDGIIAACARSAHEANRAYCLAIGDKSIPPWDDAPEWQRKSCVEGVEPTLAGATPEQLHELWCAAKYRDGWKLGPVKDAERKTHPALVPYSALPIHQRRKDALYRATVLAMAEALAGPLR